ncbi:MAG: hypothetical protein JW856_05275 [Dehalococcoidales bacterium]|nr:hypothetical protein [Dehalococcoidales bacterium]
MAKDERDKLRTLLVYWIEHNREHCSEFAEWAEKAKAMGEEELARDIRQAAEQMDKAGVLFSRSLKKLGGK